MTSEVAQPVAHESSRWRILLMPWRWGKIPLAMLVVLWTLFYVASYPIVETWQGSGAFHASIGLNEAVTGLYLPLLYATENSSACFSLYVWELRLLAGSRWLAWTLPRPIEQDEIYPWVLNPDGSSAVESTNPSTSSR